MSDPADTGLFDQFLPESLRPKPAPDAAPAPPAADTGLFDAYVPVARPPEPEAPKKSWLGGVFGTAMQDAIANRARGDLLSVMAGDPGSGMPMMPISRLDDMLAAADAAKPEAVKAELAKTFGRTEPEPGNFSDQLKYVAGRNAPDLVSMLPFMVGPGAISTGVRTGMALAPTVLSATGRTVAQNVFPGSSVAEGIGDVGGELLLPGTYLAGKGFGSLVSPIFRPESFALRRGSELLRDALPGGRAPTNPAAAAVPQVADAEIAALGDPAGRTRDQINTLGHGEVRSLEAASEASASQKFKDADLGGATTPFAPLAERFQNFVSGLTTADRRALPSTWKDLVNEIGEKMDSNLEVPLSEVQGLRTNLLAAKRSTTDENEKRVLGALENAVFRGGNSSGGAIASDLLGIDPTKGKAWNDAIAAWRNHQLTFGDDSALGNVLGGRATYPSNTLDKLLGHETAGQPERVASFLGATEGPEGATARQLARDWFAERLQRARTAGGKGFEDFVTNNDPLIRSDLLSDEQRQLVEAMRRRSAFESLTGGGRIPPNVGDTVRTGLFSPEQREGMALMQQARRQQGELSAEPLTTMGIPTWAPKAVTAIGLPLFQQLGRAYSRLGLPGGGLLENPLEAMVTMKILAGPEGGGGGHIPGMAAKLYTGPFRNLTDLLAGAAASPEAAAALAQPVARPRSRLTDVMSGAAIPMLPPY